MSSPAASQNYAMVVDNIPTGSPLDDKKVTAITEDARAQPWKKILDAAGKSHETNPQNDFFKCSEGFYTQSLSG